jgi:hypothetical protein
VKATFDFDYRRISATPPWQRRWAATGTAGIIAPDCKQVMLAVATDPEGIPLHVEVLRGNRADTKTLQGLLYPAPPVTKTLIPAV